MQNKKDIYFFIQIAIVICLITSCSSAEEIEGKLQPGENPNEIDKIAYQASHTTNSSEDSNHGVGINSVCKNADSIILAKIMKRSDLHRLDRNCEGKYGNFYYDYRLENLGTLAGKGVEGNIVVFDVSRDGHFHNFTGPPLEVGKFAMVSIRKLNGIYIQTKSIEIRIDIDSNIVGGSNRRFNLPTEFESLSDLLISQYEEGKRCGELSSSYIDNEEFEQIIHDNSWCNRINLPPVEETELPTDPGSNENN